MPFDRFTYWQEYKRKNAKKYSLKRTAIIRTPIKIKQVSDKRKKQLREYEKVKAKFFESVKVCQYPGCNETNLELHHAHGRIGKFLTDIDTFRGLCHYHHSYCEFHPIEAKELGLSGSRLDTTH